MLTYVVLWKVYGECDNFAAIPAHNGAILDLAWSADGT